jgi:hypothetical protein
VPLVAAWVLIPFGAEPPNERLGRTQILASSHLVKIRNLFFGSSWSVPGAIAILEKKNEERHE